VDVEPPQAARGRARAEPAQRHAGALRGQGRPAASQGMTTWGGWCSKYCPGVCCLAVGDRAHAAQINRRTRASSSIRHKQAQARNSGGSETDGTAPVP
jgi:hypothetical protein